MKKAICVLLALLMFTGTLAGCGKNDAAETIAATTIVETTAEETTTASVETTAVPVSTDEQILALPASEFVEYLHSINTEGLPEEEAEKKIYGLKARQFLNYMKTKRADDIAEFVGGMYYTDAPYPESKQVTNEAYRIFEKIDIDSYDISPSDSSHYEFIVTLHISKSESALFPVGTSRWILITEDPNILSAEIPHEERITLFKSIYDTSSDDFYNNRSGAAYFCNRVSTYLGCFETMDDFNKLVPDVKNIDSFSGFCGFLVNMLLQNRDGDFTWEAYPVKRSEAEALAKKTFGITKIDFKRCRQYNSADDTIGQPETIGLGRSVALSGSTYDQATRIRTVVLDYYCDPAYLLIAKTMKYTLRENTDGTLTLLSTELVYDSGYEMWTFST